jgi:hypothetical protein
VTTAAVDSPIVRDVVLQSNDDIMVGGDFSVGGTVFNLAGSCRRHAGHYVR